MISFIAHAASSDVSDSPLTSAPISAGQVVLASMTARLPDAAQAGEICERSARARIRRLSSRAS